MTNVLRNTLLVTRELGERTLRSLPGFRLAVLASFSIIGASAIAVCVRRGKPASLPALLTLPWRTYLVEYWSDHLIGLLALVFVVVVVGATDFLAIPLARFVPAPPVERYDLRRDYILTRATWLTILFGVSIYAILLPLLHLIVPNFVSLLLYGLYLSLSVLTYFATIRRSGLRPQVQRLGSLSFRRPPSFDSASFGRPSIEADDAVRDYMRQTLASPNDPAVIRVITGEAGGVRFWRGNDSLLAELAAFLDVDVQRLALHQNTTSAVRSIADFVHVEGARAVLTDLEYPSVASVIADRFGKENAAILSAHHAVWDGRLGARALASSVADEAIASAAIAPLVLVCVSHVAYRTGFIFDLTTLCSRIGAASARDRIVILVDGAQAVGNITLMPSEREAIHFYAFSGHKWLLSQKTLGITLFNAGLIKRPAAEIAGELARSRPFAYYRQPVSYLQETVEVAPHFSLNASLRDFRIVGQEAVEAHNTRLASIFRENLALLDIGDVPRFPQRGGMVTVQLKNASRVRALLFVAHGYAVHDVSDPDGIRVSLHYYMSENDVRAFTYALAEAVFGPA